MNTETDVLLKILKSQLYDGSTPVMIPSDCSYSALFSVAKRNSVANMAAFYMQTDNKIPEDIKEKFIQEKNKIIYQQILCEQVIKEVGLLLENSGIRGIILKGSLLKDLYPNPFMRSMSDIDVYAERESIDKLYGIMLERGYETGTIDEGNHFEFLKYKVAKIEFHPELVALESAYGQQVYSKLHNGKIADRMEVWNHTLPYHDNEFLRELVPEYHYLYIIMHMLGHFMAAGTGIRSVIDVWVMNKHYGEKWKREEIDLLLERFGLSKFEMYARALADRWFTLPEYAKKNVDQESLNLFEDYILSSGTYGNTERGVLSGMKYDTGIMSKFGFLLRSWLLPLKVMERQYPVLKKVPLLLPVMWIYRVYDVIHNRKSSAIKKLSSVMGSSRDDADKMNTLFSSVIY